MESGFYVGIDGGGTGSRVLVEYGEARAPLRLSAGPLNVCSTPKGDAGNTLAGILLRVAEASGGLSGCRGLGIGAAGFSNPEAGPFLRAEAMRHLPPGTPVRIDSDAVAALYGAHHGARGIVLLSGTGAVCFGANGESRRQIGGAGHLIDDGGSGYAIGRDVLSAVVRAVDGRGGPTALQAALAGARGLVTVGDIVGWVYAPDTGKEDIAALAPLLTPACARGDAVALAIAGRAAGELLQLALTASRLLRLPEGPLALGGSILLKEPFIRALLLEKLRRALPDMQIYDAKSDAAQGAVLMAREAAREETA